MTATAPERPGASPSTGRRYPKRRRLRKRRDFLRVQDRSARVTTVHFILLLAPRPDAGPCRLGVVASKKVGGAVARNRVKRLLREAFRRRYALFPEGLDLVVIAKPFQELSLGAVLRELDGVASLVARRARSVGSSSAAASGPRPPAGASPANADVKQRENDASEACAPEGRGPKCGGSGAMSR